MTLMAESSPPVGTDAIAFDRAEYAGVAPATSLPCTFCKNAIDSEYWQIGNRVACAACRHGFEQDVARAHTTRGFLRALQAGALVAAVGSVAWIVITKVTGYELGIIAVGIGFTVGKAVRKGSGGLGGPRYKRWRCFSLIPPSLSRPSRRSSKR